MTRPRLATVWLDGCSGCHMSVLDMDERLLDITARADLVYSPLVDTKVFPEGVDIALVEGAVSTEDDLRRIGEVRAHTKVLVALGDCAVTSNVPGMRNPYGPAPLLQRAFVDTADVNPQLPGDPLPALLARSRPVHEVVDVDVFLPGCPPHADLIYRVLDDLIEGRVPDTSGIARFGR